MSILGWNLSNSNQSRARMQNPEPSVRDAIDQEGTEARSLPGNDSTAELRNTSIAAPERYLSRMAVKVGDKIVLVSMSDVLWIQSHGNLVRLHLQNTSYDHRTTITNTHRHLDPGRFVRVHRNAIVNLDYVIEFDLPQCGNAFVYLRNGKALPISKTARQVLRRGLLSQSYASAHINAI
jgi:DNA-binding LytR/AlgR family response regulator